MPPEWTNLVWTDLIEIPYLGGFGWDFIRNYPQNNFVEFESGMDSTDPNAVQVSSITVGPGKSVAIAGSDCFFGDNFTFDRLVKWTVEEEFTINATTFIPGNFVIGPPQSRCVSKANGSQQLYFAGDDRTFDPSATSYRTRQLISVVTEESLDPDVLKEGSALNDTGVTKSYAADAILNGYIDAADNDAILHDCHLLHDRGRASNIDMHIVAVRLDPHTVRVNLFGSASNPLVATSIIATIDWDFAVEISNAGPSATWELTGRHDGFPVYEIYINDESIYQFSPPPPPYTFEDDLRLLLHPMEVSVADSGVLE